MKLRNSFAVVAVCTAASLMTLDVQAQSAFAGFYGQASTGYENNQASNLNATATTPGEPNDSWSSSNQSFSSAPLILGLGYNFSIASQWILGVGADYSAITSKSSTFNKTQTVGDHPGDYTSGNQLQLSNRFNIFLSPGYAIDKDKLVYLKAGYSSVSLKTMGSTSCGIPSACPNVNYSNPSNTLSGYVLGLGYKQIIAGGLYGYLEANYMSYKSATFNSINQNGGVSATTFTTNPNLSTYQTLVGLGYAF
ncbi:outer membrane protein [Polynucleobacter sp. AP-Melu-500A-A1]|uniref:outer membrane protein n=1 Tax=Polynucleobacter sp. AP-Melu-500A-A1 TaxID=2576929 RepID=UPI001C0D1F17|nr:outer membrane beta-barrel protein [Polynucleobacter sp. AP-Melu-500A-A1]MBU3631688.1 outer membrane beta-barrel protein [Polynucleobacter sp. AP-Melu-500A-A1]